MNTIEILLNGESRKVTSSNIAALLSELNLVNRKVALELNREIVPRTAYESTFVKNGDAVEIVNFVGGG